MITHKGIRTVAEYKGLKIIDCITCGFCHLESGGLKESDYEVDMLYRQFSKKDWLNKERLEYQQGLWDTAYKYQQQVINKRMKWLSLIDVGCGSGYFLNFLQREAIPWIVLSGTEVSQIARDHAYPGTKENIYLPNDDKIIQGYDIVRLALVLEHIQYLLPWLYRWVNTWKPYYILVVVPNEFNPLQKRIGGNWFISPVHWNYFTPQGLHNLFSPLGYQETFRGATFPMELFALMGFNYINNDELGRKCHVARLKWEKILGPMIFSVYGLLHRQLRWGREMIYLYERTQ